MSDWLNRPAILEVADNYDSLLRGLGTQPEQLTDINFDPEVKHFLFKRNSPFGSDLRALDIQRSRDHGLASYNDYREFCGLRRATRWEDFLDLMTPRSLSNLQQLYASWEDVDLTVGGSLEAHIEGTLAGPTFLCILTEQFYRTRVGDRYFYERGDREFAFSRGININHYIHIMSCIINWCIIIIICSYLTAQLAEIQKASISRLLCDNSNHVQSIQPSGFIRVSKA